MSSRIHKNSSGDEIANVNFFTMISHTYFKIPKKENILCLTNYTIARQRQVLSIKYWIYKSATDRRQTGRQTDRR